MCFFQGNERNICGRASQPGTDLDWDRSRPAAVRGRVVLRMGHGCCGGLASAKLFGFVLLDQRNNLLQPGPVLQPG